MTHDELLAELSIPIILKAGIQETDIVNVDLLVKRNKALRAVVEIHKPLNDPLWANSIICQSCTLLEKRIAYPCPTIQAIEIELS